MNNTGNALTDFHRFETAHAATIDALTARVRASCPDEALTDLHWALIDEMKGMAGAAAANAVSDRDAEAAIDAAEATVGDDLSQDGVRTTVALTLYFSGIEEGTRELLKAFPQEAA